MGHFKITSHLFLAVYVLGHVPFCPIYAPGGAVVRIRIFGTYLSAGGLLNFQNSGLCIVRNNRDVGHFMPQCTPC